MEDLSKNKKKDVVDQSSEEEDTTFGMSVNPQAVS
jgi:hypothetical protein